MLAIHSRYDAICNRHAFHEPFGVHLAFSACRREIRRTVHEEPSPAVHFRDRASHLEPWRGVARTGKPVTTDEFAMYRFEDGRIAGI